MCDYVSKRQVYDMETIRGQYEADMKRHYQTGCMDGTSYPPEWRLPTSDFNTHSTMSYCDNMLSIEIYNINHDVLTLGKSVRA